MKNRIVSVLLMVCMTAALFVSGCGAQTGIDAKGEVQTVEVAADQDAKKTADTKTAKQKVSDDKKEKKTQAKQTAVKETVKTDKVTAEKQESKMSETTKTKAVQTTAKSESKSNTAAKKDTASKAATKNDTSSKDTTKKDTTTKADTTKSNSSTSSNTSSHKHDWKKNVKTIHHDAVTESVWVEDSAAWDNPILENKIVCGCGAIFDTFDEWDYHSAWSGCYWGYSTKPVQVGTEHHEATGHYEDRVIQAAYDETVTTYTCSCGATK